MPQSDWPPRVTVTGFPFFQQRHEVPTELQTWLNAGPAPLIFTLGSSAVLEPGRFFAESVLAANKLGQRALLIGHVEGGLQSLVRGGAVPHGHGQLLDGGMAYAVPYADYAAVFPQAAAVVHQGGIGTTAETLRAGRPMLVVPFGVDQPDNAVRAARLGVAEVLRKGTYRADRVAAAISRLLASAEIQARAGEIGNAVRAECGAALAAETILNVTSTA